VTLPLIYVQCWCGEVMLVIYVIRYKTKKTDKTSFIRYLTMCRIDHFIHATYIVATSSNKTTPIEMEKWPYKRGVISLGKVFSSILVSQWI
jgi:hypothetical protein